MAALFTTASQTVGPFSAIGFSKAVRTDLAPPGVHGTTVTIRGRVIDGDCVPISDAVIETWQANAYGKYDHPDDTSEKPVDALFRGFGRVLTDGEGAFRLHTIKPGCVPGPAGAAQAPHLVVAVFTRGLLKHLMTRVYFPDEPNADDPVLKLVPAARRATLIAKPIADEPGVLEWNIILQGTDETVFLDY